MTKEEIKNLDLLVKLVEDLENDLENLGVLAKDTDGAFTDNSMVVLHKISHIKNELKNSWQNDKLVINDWG